MNEQKKKSRFTLLGILASVIWGSGSAFGRSMAETYGNFSSTGLSNVSAGVILTAVQIKRSGLKSYGQAPLKYWLICGPIYVLYKLTTGLAVGVAATREQVVTSGLLRLMWPMMTLIMAVIMFRKENKTSKWFIPSILLSIVGILVANTDVENFSVLNTLKIMCVDAFWPSLLSVVSSIAWGLYSNLNRKIVGDADYDAVGLFRVITGLLSYGVTFFVAEPQVFHLRQMGELIYMVVFSSFLGTLFWNLSMQKGDHMLVILVSNFMPVLSTVISAVLLGVTLTWPMVAGSLMVVAGTLFCKASIKPLTAEAA